MGIRDLLKKKDKIEEGQNISQTPSHPLNHGQDVSEFTFMRTTSTTEEIISPPHTPHDEVKEPSYQPSYTIIDQTGADPDTSKRRSSFRRSFMRHKDRTEQEEQEDTKTRRSLSERLHIGSPSKSRTSSDGSVQITDGVTELDGQIATDAETEAKWEKRATILAQCNALPGASSAEQHSFATHTDARDEKTGQRSRSVSASNAESDQTLQNAIRLHEEGDLRQSTALFGKLADPKGANNALSQVLYGLALRHGWGIEKDETSAVRYLSHAAANSAEIEALALDAGSKRGGVAKGELTLAIFELANCFRNGWGVRKDPAMAKAYYETAANMGDLDAMEEVAYCYVEGFGCKKDKFKASQYLRRAEEHGRKTVGNSWIWKDKYGKPKTLPAA